MATKFNDAFWKWFGDSKVVDEHGQPLVVWHGTNEIDFLFDERELYETVIIPAWEKAEASGKTPLEAFRTALEAIGHDGIIYEFYFPSDVIVDDE
jgi:hypothetical protein